MLNGSALQIHGGLQTPVGYLDLRSKRAAWGGGCSRVPSFNFTPWTMDPHYRKLHVPFFAPRPCTTQHWLRCLLKCWRCRVSSTPCSLPICYQSILPWDTPQSQTSPALCSSSPPSFLLGLLYHPSYHHPSSYPAATFQHLNRYRSDA